MYQERSWNDWNAAKTQVARAINYSFDFAHVRFTDSLSVELKANLSLMCIRFVRFVTIHIREFSDLQCLIVSRVVIQ